MAYKNQQSAVSKPLLIALVAVAIIGIIYFVTRMGGEGDPEGTAAGGMDVPESIRNLPPATPQPGEPSPIGMGDR